jgi:di/tricarboxylate transporter
MIANALFVSTVFFLAAGFYLMGALKYLAPYRALLWHEYAAAILAYAAVFFINLFALAYYVNRKFFLKDTGRKLAHFDKEIQQGEHQLSAEMARRLGGLQ